MPKEPSLVVLTNLIQRIGRDGVLILLHLLKDGRTYEEISQAFPGAGLDPSKLSRIVARVYKKDWFLFEECELFMRKLLENESILLRREQERNELRLIVGGKP